MMIRHFKTWVLILGLILAALLLVFAGSLFVGSCSYRDNCMTGGRSQSAHTPVPTLVLATLQANGIPVSAALGSEACSVSAGGLLSAWVSAGAPETQAFLFTDANGVSCKATFADVQPLFSEANLWYPGALACTACHNAALSSAASAQLDLSSYAGVVAGSHRTSGSASGQDILGAGSWQASRLNQALFVLRQMPYGRQPDVLTGTGPLILAGLPVSVANATATAVPAQAEVAAPSNPGDAGDAVNLTGDPVAGKQVYLSQCQLCHGDEGKGDVLNPGSDDGTVPALNPIDDTLIGSDDKTNFFNIDLFIQNGSTPPGINPARFMPPFGAQNGLTQQQIADVIAYLISINK